MLRIGGNLNSVLVPGAKAKRAVQFFELLGLTNLTSAPISVDLECISMTATRSAAIDFAVGIVGGFSITGFELLTAGVIQSLETLSNEMTVGYAERRFGITVTDCAVAWTAGSISWGPAGSVVGAGDEASAASDLLLHLGVAPFDLPAVLTRWSEAGAGL